MKPMNLRRLSSMLLPKPSRVLREINSNALMVEWSKNNPVEQLFKHRFELFEMINANILRNEQVDYFEFGVFKGESLSKWAALNKHPESRFFGFDTFEGLPEKWDRISRPLAATEFDAGGNFPIIDDRRVTFVKGLFQDSLRPFLSDYAGNARLVMHNDSDLYSSTLYCLTMLDAFLANGSIIIFDEFYSSSHEFQAFYDYVVSYRRKYRVIGAVGKNPYGQVAIAME